MNPTRQAQNIAVLQDLPDSIAKAVHPRRILVVEDNLDSVHTLVLLLRQMGHEVEFAINGYAALQVAERFRPEFVLLDLGLPGMDGYAVCTRLKAMPALATSRIVALTAYTADEHRARSKIAGCDLHLIKPVPPRVLEQLLNT